MADFGGAAMEGRGSGLGADAVGPDDEGRARQNLSHFCVASDGRSRLDGRAVAGEGAQGIDQGQDDDGANRS